jgi:hypothetical protein
MLSGKRFASALERQNSAWYLQHLAQTLEERIQWLYGRMQKQGKLEAVSGGIGESYIYFFILLLYVFIYLLSTF